MNEISGSEALDTIVHCTTRTDGVGRTSAILPERYGTVLLRQVRRLEAVLVLEPGHDLLTAAAKRSGVAVQEDDGGDEHGGRRHGHVGRRTRRALRRGQV